MASFMATFGGTSSLSAYKSSDKPMRKTFLSIIAIWAIGHSGAAFSMTLSIFHHVFCYRFYQLPDKSSSSILDQNF